MDSAQDVKILLLEDEPDVRESYQDMFGFLGFDIDTASDGREGLDKLTKRPYHIVLTDLNMPVMDGLEVLRRVKKMSSDIEVIVITGFATIENAIGAMKQGAFDYITKPIALDHLKIVINKCVQQIRARQENKELKDKNAHLQNLNELKNKFITITNHELRTPLAVLKGYADLLAMELEMQDNTELDEYMTIINDTIREMVDMVENMHDLSNLRNFVQVRDRQIFNVNEIVEHLIHELKLLFEQRDIHLKVDLPPQALLVNGDQRLIKRAVRELVQNALKFTESGGTVAISIKDIDVRNQAFISVEDTGIGIPHDKIKYIYEPFYEVQNEMHHFTSKTDFMGGGIGVGLSLVKEIVDSNDGEIVVESTPGKGSIFTIILPKANTDQNTKETNAAIKTQLAV